MVMLRSPWIDERAEGIEEWGTSKLLRFVPELEVYDFCSQQRAANLSLASV